MDHRPLGSIDAPRQLIDWQEESALGKRRHSKMPFTSDEEILIIGHI
ncbi:MULTISPECIES: hypothetical protein [Methylobacterium]|nr:MULTISPECIES: hypothetical protein [Methylobacterium]